MSKVMVVEDDASLREIYSVRITAEGYDVVSAGDGEEALAVAVREKPDLILSDVMMPKISGFDMLDILRSTPETADIKVIMMTALSADDQRQRGERLGANRYLVKSQVGIEDVINTIHEVMGDRASAPETNDNSIPEPTPNSLPNLEPTPASEPTPTLESTPSPAPEPLLAPTPAPEPISVPEPTSIPEPTPAPAPFSSLDSTPTPEPSSDSSLPPVPPMPDMDNFQPDTSSVTNNPEASQPIIN